MGDVAPKVGLSTTKDGVLGSIFFNFHPQSVISFNDQFGFKCLVVPNSRNIPPDNTGRQFR